MTVEPSRKLRCRAISDGDLDAVAKLLSEGFKGRGLGYWRAGLQRMSRRDVPEGLPRYGYVLDCGGVIVGTLLLIASRWDNVEAGAVFANVAAWYVDPAYRGSAQLLASMALRNKAVTYLNVTPAPHTWPIVESQGYRCYCRGLFFALAPLAPGVPGVHVEELQPAPGADIAALPEFAMLRRHAGYGAIVLVCRADDGLHPFVFQPFRIRSGRLWMPGVLAIYARSPDGLVRFAGPLGRYLLRRGLPIIAMDADGPVAGLRGFFTGKRGRKYCKGPRTPRHCDLADTEFAVFGI